MKKQIAFFTAVILVIGMICFAAPVSAKNILTLDRAVMVNDSQVILEFSEPIAINLLGNSTGPYAAIRLVNNKNFLQTTRDDSHLNLQWVGSLEYLDEKMDRLIFTVNFSRLGVTTVSGVYGFEGELAAYRDLYCCMCLEEVPFNRKVPAYDGLIENVTSMDGERKLCANTVSYDGIYLRLEKDYDYQYDPTTAFSLVDRSISASFKLADPADTQKTAVKNDPLIVIAILAGGVVIALFATLLVVKKKRNDE